MVENIDSLEFTLTRSMTYTLIRLSNLIEERKKFLSINDNSYEVRKKLINLDNEIAKLKEEFISEFRLENMEQIEYYWYLRSKE